MRQQIVLFIVVLLCIAVYTIAHAPEDAVPGIIDLTNDNFEQYLNGKKPTLVEFYAPWCGHCKNLAPEMAILGDALTKARTESVQVAKVNCDDHRNVCSKFDVKGYPTIKFFPFGATTPEDYNSGRSAEDIANFLNDKAGTNIRIPKAATFVTDLTPSNFDKIVMDSDKDVLVEFYAPWCGHCKKLTPEYEKAAAAFKADKNVVIAKMDADKHKDIPSRYDIKGFPTIKFFPRGSAKNAEDYNGARDAEGIVNFINGKANLFRTSSGSLTDEAGLVGTMTASAKKFIVAAKEERDSILAEAEKAISSVATVSKKHAEQYLKYMKKFAEKGEQFVETEFARLAKILAGTSVESTRADDMKIRHNILRQFRK